MDFNGDLEEEAHFGDVVLSLAEYVADAESEIARRERAMEYLSLEDLGRFLVGNDVRTAMRERFGTLRKCARTNQDFFDMVVLPYTADVQARAQQLSAAGVPSNGFVLSSPHHMSKARSTLHQIVREWSEEGRTERERCFAPILREVENRIGKGGKIAVPGCGLGRLVVELASRGYRAQGSEFSYQMLITGDCIMNRLLASNQSVIYPWIDQSSNVREFSEHVRGVSFPDIPCVQLLSNTPRDFLSICAGDFEEIYSRQENKSQWDALVCCFFLDTASNICDYLRVAKHMLKPKGALISFGPLQWHFQPEHGGPSKSETDGRFFRSLELSLEEVIMTMKSFGFDIVHRERVNDCRYAGNSKSMVKTIYDCEFIVAILN